jgi:hypothetical protein
MNRSTGLSLAFAATLAGLAPMAAPRLASAQENYSAEELREEFIRAGYVADEPMRWSTSSATTFTVRDGDRVLMVFVHPTIETAQITHQHAAASDPEYDATSGDERRGPRLVRGFGQSLWVDNIAMIQSSQAELDRTFAEEQAARVAEHETIVRTDASEQANTRQARPGWTQPVDFDLMAVVMPQVQANL